VGGAEILRTRPNWLWGPSSLLFKGHLVLSRCKATGRDVDHPPHLTPRLKNEYINISTPSLVLHGRSHGEIYIINIIIIIIIIIIVLLITFMQGIYNYIPETNHVSRVYSVAAVQYLQFVLHVLLNRP